MAIVQSIIYNGIVLSLFMACGIFLTILYSSFHKQLPVQYAILFAITIASLLTNTAVKLIFYHHIIIHTILPWWASPSWDTASVLLFVASIIAIWRWNKC